MTWATLSSGPAFPALTWKGAGENATARLRALAVSGSAARMFDLIWIANRFHPD